MSDLNDKKPQKTSERFLRHILEVDPQKVDLKFIFDHVRNYGISYALITSGLYLSKNPEISTSFIPSFSNFWAVFLICLGYLLSVLNLSQSIIILAKLKLNIFLYVMISFFLFGLATQLFFISFKQAVLNF